MPTPDYIIDVSEVDFEYEVLSYSQNTPVVVDFWATWCKPCKQLSPILETLANQANGSFRLAKVDVDESPNLALRYGVRSIPTVKAFIGGQIVAEFVGMQPLERIHDFLAKLTPPSEESLALEKAESLLSAHDWVSAEALLRDLMKQSPEQPDIQFGLARALLARGNAREARFLLRNFPASSLYARAEILRPLAESMWEMQEEQLEIESDLDAAFNNSLRLAARGKILPALDGLLDILRQEKRYRHDRGRQIYIALLEVIGNDDPDTIQYRSDLATALF
jgi:putative thioredoxin